MVDALEHSDDKGAATTFTVKAGHIFVSGGALTEPALVENIAQTAAARMGYICRQEQKAVPVGFIGAVQNLRIYALPQTGDTLFTTIHIKNQVFNATIIEGNISVKGKPIASCEMKIFINS